MTLIDCDERTLEDTYRRRQTELETSATIALVAFELMLDRMTEKDFGRSTVEYHFNNLKERLQNVTDARQALIDYRGIKTFRRIA